MTINDRREVGKVLEKECEMWEWEQDRGGNLWSEDVLYQSREIAVGIGQVVQALSP
jgi:hypothetical protein